MKLTLLVQDDEDSYEVTGNVRIPPFGGQLLITAYETEDPLLDNWAAEHLRPLVRPDYDPKRETCVVVACDDEPMLVECEFMLVTLPA